MSFPRRIAAGLMLAGLCLSAVGGADAQTSAPGAVQQEIWFGPQASVAPSRLARAADFMDLFKPDAPWGQVASRTRVFKLYGAYLGVAPQDQVDTVVADLKRRHIAIDLEIGPMNVSYSPLPPCGGLGYVEGYSTVELAQRISRAIKKAGGEIAYVSMDEPLYYGHVFSGPHACHHPVVDIARLAAQTLKVYVAEFPNVIIGDTEPTSFGTPEWKADFAAWASAYRDVMGRPLAFLQLDIEWPLPNGVSDAVAVYRYAEELKREHLLDKVGVIYNASRREQSDAEWVRVAEENMRLLEQKDGLRPDLVIIQSWTPLPTHTLPESSNETLTGLAQFYLTEIAPSLSSGK